MGHSYGRLVPGSSARVAGEPAADGGASVFFLASCVLNQLSSPVKATPFITGNPHGDRNPSRICNLGVMRRASQGVSPATTRLWKSVVLDPNEVGRPLIAGQPTPKSMTS